MSKDNKTLTAANKSPEVTIVMTVHAAIDTAFNYIVTP